MSSREWFQRGDEFLEEAEGALSRGRYWFACFNSHQAAEFYLKGKLIELCGSYTFTHDLTVLQESSQLVIMLGFRMKYY